jgi:hypothetical protein
MNAWEIVTIIISVLTVLGVIVGSSLRKKNGKSSCRSDCVDCPYHKDCRKIDKKIEN